ncbi:hypothetical protein L596_013750 [Steinernema carpocapsae]|uniref:Uncharacterized protein n=1 Tax=Steinernema carpocapsae TaxID=34508 RepID=A0A4V6A578_STECR|nr:hypothetical protein L596_013750 [Steinernema carpocapsae]
MCLLTLLCIYKNASFDLAKIIPKCRAKLEKSTKTTENGDGKSDHDKQSIGLPYQNDCNKLEDVSVDNGKHVLDTIEE